MAIPFIVNAGEYNAAEFYSQSADYIVSPQNLMEMKHPFIVEQLKIVEAAHPQIFLREVGQSVERRSINMLTFGQGKTKVLLWSQMHGDEPTATAALLSVYLYFARNFDSPFVQELYKNLTIHSIVMLNPDGAQRYQRRNAQGIDINRDAQRLVCPESRVLKGIKEDINPEYGFNLHNMGGRETAGDGGKLLNIALMAPPFNKGEEASPTRDRAKQLVVEIKRILDQLIEGHVAKYKADYMPRAFGDAFQHWGVSTVLIESGLTDNTDPHYLVKINFVALLGAFDAIASGRLADIDPEKYTDIPLEGIEVYDILLKDVLVYNGKNIPPFRADIGINIDRVQEDGNLVYKSTIEDLGDLSITTGREEISGESLIATPGFFLIADDPSPAEAMYVKGITTVINPGDVKKPSLNDNTVYPGLIVPVEKLAQYTSETAALAGDHKSGVIRKGMVADILIFDQVDSGKLSLDHLKYVLKNGKIVLGK